MQGLTFGVLQHILQQLRESERSLQHSLFQVIAKEYIGEKDSGAAFHLYSSATGML